MTVIQSISRGVGKGLNFANETLKLKKVSEYGFKNPDSFANAMLVASIASKDALGCAMYVTQSLNNERIPENRRGFVAALDLVNGILMVGGQVLIAKVFEKHLTGRLFDKTVGKKLDKDTLAEHAEKFIAESKKAGKNFDLKDANARLVKEFGTGSLSYKAMRGGAGLFISFLLTTALTKRVIVPFIATPVAGLLKDKFMTKKKSAPVMTPAMIDSTMTKTSAEKTVKSSKA